MELEKETDKSYVQVDAPVGRRKVTCTGSLLKVIFPRTQLTRRLFVYSTRCTPLYFPACCQLKWPVGRADNRRQRPQQR